MQRNYPNDTLKKRDIAHVFCLHGGSVKGPIKRKPRVQIDSHSVQTLIMSSHTSVLRIHIC